MPAADPLATIVGLVAADVAGQIPVVVRPDTPLDTAAVLAAAADEPRRHGLDPEIPLLVVHTSGSSGTPRAVVRTVASWTTSLPGYSRLTGETADDVAWAPGSVASTLTLFALWHALATGVPAAGTGPWRGVPDVPVVAEATVVHAVPPVAADVLTARLDGALPRLRRLIVAGSAVPPVLRATAQAAGVQLVEYYGAAELSFVAADPDGRGLRPFAGVRLRVRDGRIEVRSPYVALGYLAGASGPLAVDREGWAGVGDLGRLTADGALLVAGRGDQAISVGSDIVLVADVERVLASVPGVAEVVCVGEPHARLGARLVAVVRPRRDAPDDLVQRLRRQARTALGPPARPVRYLLVDDLPRTPAGKVSRLAVPALVRRGRRPA